MINRIIFENPIPIKKIYSIIDNPIFDIREETNDKILDYFDNAIDIKLNTDEEITEVKLFELFNNSEANLLGLVYALLEEEDESTVSAIDSSGLNYSFNKESLFDYLEEF